jgi:hypothetical protein
MNRRENVLFSVPIYLESEDNYYHDIDCKNREKKENLKAKLEKYAQKEIPDDYFQSVSSPQRSWRYNRIIGWIEFICNCRSVKADLWFAKERSIRKTFKAVDITYNGKVADVIHAYNSSNSEIRKSIKSFILKFESGAYSAKYKKYYVDKNGFFELLNFIDINKLISIKGGVK